MCHADLEIETFDKVEDMVGPFPNFSVRSVGILTTSWNGRRDIRTMSQMRSGTFILETPNGIREFEAEGSPIPAV